MLATPTAMRLPSSLLRARTPAAMLLCRRTMQPLQPLQPLLHRRAMSAAPPPPSPSKAAASTGAVIEITNTADFEPLVMAASSQNPPVGGPVIVDFYADWCQPCKQLLNHLVKCGAPSTCPVCSPWDLPPALVRLRSLNHSRDKGTDPQPEDEKDVSQEATTEEDT